MRAAACLLLVPALLAACATGPESMGAAMERCRAEAYAADGVTGEVKLGVNSQRGAVAGASIGVTDALFAPDRRPPAEIYEQCVVRRTGRAPTRPL